MNRWTVALPALLAAGLAYAGFEDVTAVAEPGTFELLALGAVAVLVLRFRNRRK